MKIVFRVDSSVAIGTGHVSRCLALAHSLKIRGHECTFLSRNHAGNMNDYIVQCGYTLHVLKNEEVPRSITNANKSEYADWLYCGWEDDATQCLKVMHNKIDLLIVDHYALDYRWEGLMLKSAVSILCIDDLANRSHDCHVLLDQTIVNNEFSYKHLVSEKTKLLIGPKFALLREEFREWREQSLSRRKDFKLEKILVSLGGVDRYNVTRLIVNAIEKINLENAVNIDVILKSNSPHYKNNQDLFAKKDLQINLIPGTKEMARLLCGCDIAIGAGGSSTLERFCLGVPSVVVPIADNQKKIVTTIHKRNLGFAISSLDKIEEQLMKIMTNITSHGLSNFCERSANLCDGLGINRVISCIEALND